MFAGFAREDAEIIIEIARELTGMRVDIERHSVIIHNVSSRMRAIRCKSLGQYLSLAEADEAEYEQLLSCLTIHTTSWFREPAAFEVFSEIVTRFATHPTGAGPFKFLSVGCSSGEEVYSFGAYLERQRLSTLGFEYTLEGWDIDPVSLRQARNGTYVTKGLEQLSLTSRNLIPLLRNDTQVENGKWRVSASLVDRARFRAVDALALHPVSEKYHFISCRNMLIYFDSRQVEKIVEGLTERLLPGGHLCTGVSEVSALGDFPYKSCGSAVFEWNGRAGPAKGRTDSVPAATLVKIPKPQRQVLVVEDETEIREMLVDVLTNANYRVRSAANAQEAQTLLKDAEGFGMVFSDYRMAGKNGVELCKEMRGAGYTGAFVLLTAFGDAEMSRFALSAGVNEVFSKPFSEREIVKLAQVYLPPEGSNPFLKSEFLTSGRHSHADVLAFGASTGGTELLVRLLCNLPKDCPPVLVVQHIAPAFASDFARRLAQSSGLKLARMREGEILARGSLYIATEDYHIGVLSVAGHLCLHLSTDPKMSGHRPSVDYLFSSLAKSRARCLAALLTGMGRDGASGLYKLRVQGSTTIAQNETSCVVFGMPKEAIELRAAMFVMNPQQIRAKVLGAIAASAKLAKAG